MHLELTTWQGVALVLAAASLLAWLLVLATEED